jgi:hypothetical protein
MAKFIEFRVVKVFELIPDEVVALHELLVDAELDDDSKALLAVKDALYDAI